MARPDTSQLKGLLESAHSISLLLPHDPDYDSVAAALALSLSLKSAGKTVTVVCPDSMTVQFNRLVGVESVSSSISAGRSLVISFPDQTEHVDKVSYNLDHGELQLVITPKSGGPDLDYRRLKFTSNTGLPEVLMLVGVNRFSDLGKTYDDIREHLDETKLVSLTRTVPAENYAPHQVFDSDASGVSELAAFLLDSMELSFPADSATNLFLGLETATDGFRSPHMTPATFETAALLLKKGAQRQAPLSAQNFPPGSIPQTSSPAAATPPAAQAGFGTDGKPEDPPSDWYEPKIYQGPMLP